LNDSLLAPQPPRQHPVQSRREGLPVLGSVGARTAGLDAGSAQAVHEIADGEALADVLFGVLLAAGIEHRDPLLDQTGGERDVGGDGDVACFSLVRDVAVGDVWASRDLHRGDEGMIERRRQPLVGDEHGRQLQPARGAEDDLLHVARSGVGVDPDFHGPTIWVTFPSRNRPSLMSGRESAKMRYSPPHLETLMGRSVLLTSTWALGTVLALTDLPCSGLDLDLSPVKVPGGEIRFNTIGEVPVERMPDAVNVQSVATEHYVVTANLDEITYTRNYGFFQYKLYVRPRPGTPGQLTCVTVNGDSIGLFPVQMSAVDFTVGEGEIKDSKQITLPVISSEATKYLVMPALKQPAEIDLPGEAVIALTIENVLKKWPVSVIACTPPASKLWHKSGLRVRDASLDCLDKDFHRFDIRPGTADSLVALRLVPNSAQLLSRMFFSRAGQNDQVVASLDYDTPWGIQDSLDIKIPVRFVPSLPLLFLALAVGAALGSVLPVLAGKRRWSRWPRTFAVALLCAVVVEVLARVVVELDSQFRLFGVELDPKLLGPAILIGVTMGLLGFRSLGLLEKILRQDKEGKPEPA
jgi:hypothetical protein